MMDLTPLLEQLDPHLNDGYAIRSIDRGTDNVFAINIGHNGTPGGTLDAEEEGTESAVVNLRSYEEGILVFELVLGLPLTVEALWKVMLAINEAGFTNDLLPSFHVDSYGGKDGTDELPKLQLLCKYVYPMGDRLDDPQEDVAADVHDALTGFTAHSLGFFEAVVDSVNSLQIH